MGVGLNFVCNRCGYDTGVLMLANGMQRSIHEIVDRFIDIYLNETDQHMLVHRAALYKMMAMYLSTEPEENINYYFEACVCHGCNRTYEMLDIFIRQEKEAGILAKETQYARVEDISLGIYGLPEGKWKSIVGEQPFCLFCDHPVVTISTHSLKEGIQCPKCQEGHLKSGSEFLLWN